MKFVGIILLLLSGASFAADINYIDPGDVYYLSQLGSNEAVMVVRVDRTYSRVKIRDQEGFTEWVSASRLLQKKDNFENEVNEGAAWVLGGMILLCAMDDECRNSADNNSRSSSHY